MKFSIAFISLAVCAVEFVGAGVLRQPYDGDVDAPHHPHHGGDGGDNGGNGGGHHHHGGGNGGNGGGHHHHGGDGGDNGGNGGGHHHHGGDNGGNGGHPYGGNGGGNGGGGRGDDMNRPCPQWTTCPAQLPRGSQCWLAKCFKRELLRLSNPSYSDHFFTWNGNPKFATPNEAVSKYGYSMAGNVGSIIACPGVPGTAPLYQWANTTPGTHGYTVDRSQIPSLAAPYQQFSVIGYVFEKGDECAGLKPLFEETIQGTNVGTVYDMNNNGVGGRLGYVL